MRKRIAIFGGSLFQDIRVEQGKYIKTNKDINIKLTKNYDVDNFSMNSMTSTRALRLINALNIKELYNDCILALGEYDLDNSALFEENLRDIVNTLFSNNVRPLLVSLPQELLKDAKALRIQNIIDRIAVEFNIDYIYDGNTDKTVSYMVLDGSELKDAILSLC